MNEKGSILVVDDNLSLVKTMSFVLARKGYDVATASDGNEALERVREKTFDLIFMGLLLLAPETWRPPETSKLAGARPLNAVNTHPNSSAFRLLGTRLARAYDRHDP